MATTVTLKPNAIDISGSSSGTTTVQATAVAGTTTLTLPAATDTLVGKATTDTLTNKTINASQLVDASIAQAKLAAGVAGNGPAFFAYSATTTTLTAATDVKIILDTELFDTNSDYSTANSRFTPTVAGYYQVNGVMNVNFWNSTILTCAIFKNGSAYSRGNTAYPQTVGGVRSVVSSLVYMNGTTDYIEMYGFNFNASTSNVVVAAQEQTNFSASLVRSA